MVADEGRTQRRRGYPVIPATNWRELRRRFAATPPRGDVNAAYLAGVLNISERTAANVMPALRQLGLIDAQNRLTDRAVEWRDDDQYATVTQQMLEEVYPQALRDVAPPPNPNRETAKRWFMRDLNAGEAQGERLAFFYVMLASGDPNPLDELQEDGHPQRQRQTRARPQRAAGVRAREGTPEPPSPVGGGEAQALRPISAQQGSPGPSLHIDLQVHIDPAATPDQIDAIFASMARHLYGRD